MVVRSAVGVVVAVAVLASAAPPAAPLPSLTLETALADALANSAQGQWLRVAAMNDLQPANSCTPVPWDECFARGEGDQANSPPPTQPPASAFVAVEVVPAPAPLAPCARGPVLRTTNATAALAPLLLSPALSSQQPWDCFEVDAMAEPLSSLVRVDLQAGRVALHPVLVAAGEQAAEQARADPTSFPSTALAAMGGAVAGTNATARQLTELAARVWRAPRASPLKCTACVVLATFASLFATNLGLEGVGCVVCGCLQLTNSACQNLLQSLLLVVIALEPLLAVLVFRVCKSLCESDLASLAAPPSLVERLVAADATAQAPLPADLATAHAYLHLVLAHLRP